MKPQIFIVFFSVILLSACATFRPHAGELFKSAINNQPYDVIIVPGNPFNGIRWDTIMKGRIIWANYLFQKGYAKNIIFSGGAVYTPYTEAKIYALYAEALGVPKEHIFIEDRAEHSTENVYYSTQLAKKLGFKKIAVATDTYQSPRLMGFTGRRISKDIDFIPFIADTLKKINGVNPLINASSAKVENFHSIVETQSKWYRLRGTLGKHIKYEKE